MNLHISGDAERIIRFKLQGGQFASESEVVEEACACWISRVNPARPTRR